MTLADKIVDLIEKELPAGDEEAHKEAYKGLTSVLERFLTKPPMKFTPDLRNDVIVKLIKFRATGRKSRTDWSRFEGDKIRELVERVW